MNLSVGLLCNLPDDRQVPEDELRGFPGEVPGGRLGRFHTSKLLRTVAFGPALFFYRFC